MEQFAGSGRQKIGLQTLTELKNELESLPLLDSCPQFNFFLERLSKINHELKRIIIDEVVEYKAKPSAKDAA